MRSEMSRSGYWSFLEIRLRPQKLTQSQREPSFFRIKRTGAPWGEWDGWINPVARFLSMKLYEITQSGKFLLGQGVYQNIGWGSAFIHSDFEIVGLMVS